MVAGFAVDGAVALVPALAVMLGANVGTTLIGWPGQSVPRPRCS